MHQQMPYYQNNLFHNFDLSFQQMKFDKLLLDALDSIQLSCFLVFTFSHYRERSPKEMRRV
jgi:hypothetical protein